MARAAIKVVGAADIHGGTYWQPDPHDTRMFFGPTGRTLDRGAGCLSDTYLVVLNGAYGITDRIMLSGGLSILPTPDFLHDNLYYLAPKVAIIRGDSFNLAAGAIVGFSGRVAGSATACYIAATNGRPDASFTYGAEYPRASGTFPGNLFFMVSGNKRVARKLALMTENYIFAAKAGLNWAPIYGVRFIGDRRSTDLGFVNYAGHNATPVFPGVPWLGFAMKF